MKVPESLKYARENSALNSIDIRGMLGISATCLYNKIYRGSFPGPDFKAGNGKYKRNEWLVSTVIKWIKEQP